MTDRQILGYKGEKATCKYLKRNKFKIIKRNFASKHGEIDIIAENKEYIIFVEVKTRSEGQLLDPKAAVNYQKQLRIMKTASAYLRDNPSSKQPRFDISEVIADGRGKLNINYLENAFYQEKTDYAVF